jgi:hypothetical protein
MNRLIAAALAASCFASFGPVFAGDGGGAGFDQWFDPGASRCVPMSAIRSVARVKELTPEQFQFVRALYVAIPPVSRKLPAGDHEIMASSGGDVMFALVVEGQACARFLAPDFIRTMVTEIGQGMTVGLGTPL